MLVLLGASSLTSEVAARASRFTSFAVNSLLLDWSFEGLQKGSELGYAVSRAGDVNGDGYDDVLVGAPHGTDTVDHEGVVYLFYGSPAGLADTPDLTLSMGEKGALFGCSVSSAGDVNGDGYDDVVIGARASKPGGAAFFYHGSDRGLSAHAVLSFSGDQRDGQLGAAVAGAGDVNGDGYDDVVVGAPQFGTGQGSQGWAFVLFGSTSGVVTTTAQIIQGHQVGALLGSSVDGAGDVNDDGYADLIVGAPRYDAAEEDEGMAVLYLGSAAGLATTSVWRVYGDQAEAYLGVAVSGTGDVNHDGFADIAVGSPGYDGVLPDQGLVQIYYGAHPAPDEVPGWVSTYEMQNARFGAALCGAGDVDADGVEDLVVGVPFYTSTPDGSGKDEPEAVMIYRGSELGLSLWYSWKLETAQSTTDFGSSVGIAGRVNQDRFDDLIVGAPNYKRETEPRGQAFVFAGAASEGMVSLIYIPLILRVTD